MLRRRLGAAGPEVSALGFGGIPIQRLTVEEAAAVVEAALEAGINFFDSARNYQDSEAKLGQVLARRRQGLVLASKSMARSADGIRKELEYSLRQWGVDRLDLYQCHNVRDEEALRQVLGRGGALEGLQRAREEGLITWIGITGHRPSVLLEAVRTGAFDTLQVPINAVEWPRVRPLVEEARAAGLGVIAMKPLAGGALASQAELALRFVLETGAVAIPGLDAVDQVQFVAGLLAHFQPLAEEERAALAQEADRLGQDFCRRCDYCQPCSAGIDIAMVFLLDGYYTRYKLEEWAISRYRELKVKVEECLDCGLCEERCPYNLPIRAKLRAAGQRLGGS